MRTSTAFRCRVAQLVCKFVDETKSNCLVKASVEAAVQRGLMAGP
jgi:hypothetical protein